MSDKCHCVTCGYCRGSGAMRVPDRRSLDGYELEQCDKCYGSGIAEECDYCRDQREMN